MPYSSAIILRFLPLVKDRSIGTDGFSFLCLTARRTLNIRVSNSLVSGLAYLVGFMLHKRSGKVPEKRADNIFVQANAMTAYPQLEETQSWYFVYLTHGGRHYETHARTTKKKS